MSTVFLISIAIMGGIAISLQGQFMGLLDRGLGTVGWFGGYQTTTSN